MRIVLVTLLAATLAGCGGRKLAATAPDVHGSGWRASQPDAAAPTESLETFMAKVRKLSMEARPARTGAPKAEEIYPDLRAALLAATVAPSPHTYRTLAYEYRRIGVFDQAHSYLNKALLLDSRDPDTYDALARLWRDTGLPHLGLSDAHRAVYYGPNSASARNTFGTVLQALGLRKEARDQYTRALTLDPRAAYALNNLCYGWLLDADTAKAIPACQRALQLEPEMAAAQNNLGVAYAVAGDMGAARRAFAASGDRARAAYNTGIVELARGHYADAVESFTLSHRERPTLALAAARARQASARARLARGEQP